MDIREILNTKVVRSLDIDFYNRIKANWDQVAKPLDSMGVFEKYLCQIGAIQQSEQPRLDRCRIIVMCADNGVVEENISQSDQSVTALCAQNIALKKSCVGVMANRENIDIMAVDVGMNTNASLRKVQTRKARNGTRNFHIEPAMNEDELYGALQAGLDLVEESKRDGFTLLGMGEMGIGNTTTSSAVAAALLQESAENVTGRGAGLDDERLCRKKQIITEAIDRYALTNKAPLEILRCVGGYDIAALTGMCIGGAVYNVPIVLDGFISMVAALVACRIMPEVKEYLIPSHSSKEPAVQKISDELGLTPVIYAKMALGEGTGAVMMMSLLKTANEVYKRSSSFTGYGMDSYERY